MSKRSEDKGDRGKSAARSTKAEPEAKSSAPVQQPATARDKADIWQNSDLYWYAGLALTAIISFYLRAIIPWTKVFSGDKVIFSSETDCWYHMMLAQGTVNNLQRLWFDPMTYFPHGTGIHFGPFLSWIIAIFSFLFGLGHPSTHTVQVVGALMPAVLGVLVIIPVYFIGKEIAGKACGLIAALMAAVLPGSYFARTTLGFTDHHAAEILLSALTIMFLLFALRYGRDLTFAGVGKNWSALKIPLLYCALAGISLGLYIDAWASGFLFEGIILVFVLIQSVVDHLRGRNVEYLAVSGAITFFIAMLLVLPFVKLYNGFSNYHYSLFHPIILLIGVVAVLVLWMLSRLLREKNYNDYYYPAALAGVVILGMLIISVAVPHFANNLFTGLSIFQPRSGGASTVGEASPFFYSGGEFSFNSLQSSFPSIVILLSSFFLALIGLLLLLWRYIKSQRPADMLLIVWSVIILVMTLAQNRFAYYYAVNVALLTGYLAVSILKSADLKIDARHILAGLLLPSLLMFLIFVTSPNLSGYLPILIIALLLQPVAWIAYSKWKRVSLNSQDLLASLVLAALFIIIIMPSAATSSLFASYTNGPDNDWLTSTAWLQNNTPSPGMDLFEKYEHPTSGRYAYPDTAYGVMSWWDYGHLIEVVGHRLANANPFQEGIGSVTTGVAGSSPFFIAENETEAENVLARLDLNRSPYLNSKYVMIDLDMATGKFHAMAAWSSIPLIRYQAAVYQPQGEELVPVQIWREPYFKTMTARLYFFDGSAVQGNEGVGIAYRAMELQDGTKVPVLTESPKLSGNNSEIKAFVEESRNQGDQAEIVSMSPNSAAIPLDALQHYRLVHESDRSVTTDNQKFVKTFEHVPGAVIKGQAPAGTAVEITVPILTNKERAFYYKQSNVSDSQGEFTLVVPYSTEGPIASGTNFDTKPMTPYQLAVGGKIYEVKVPEEYVLSGAVITV